jgi:hypothetical protein
LYKTIKTPKVRPRPGLTLYCVAGVTYTNAVIKGLVRRNKKKPPSRTALGLTVNELAVKGFYPAERRGPNVKIDRTMDLPDVCEYGALYISADI